MDLFRTSVAKGQALSQLRHAPTAEGEESPASSVSPTLRHRLKNTLADLEDPDPHHRHSHTLRQEQQRSSKSPQKRAPGLQVEIPAANYPPSSSSPCHPGYRSKHEPATSGAALNTGLATPSYPSLRTETHLPAIRHSRDRSSSAAPRKKNMQSPLSVHTSETTPTGNQGRRGSVSPARADSNWMDGVDRRLRHSPLASSPPSPLHHRRSSVAPSNSSASPSISRSGSLRRQRKDLLHAGLQVTGVLQRPSALAASAAPSSYSTQPTNTSPPHSPIEKENVVQQPLDSADSVANLRKVVAEHQQEHTHNPAPSKVWGKIKNAFSMAAALREGDELQRCERIKNSVLDQVRSRKLVDASSASVNGVPYTRQVDLNFYTEESLLKREQHKKTAEMKDVLRKWWVCADTNYDGRISQHEYANFFTKILRKLEPSFSQKKIRQLLVTEWEIDSQGHDCISWPMFFDASFELVDCLSDVAFTFL